MDDPVHRIMARNLHSEYCLKPGELPPQGTMNQRTFTAVDEYFRRLKASGRDMEGGKMHLVDTKEFVVGLRSECHLCDSLFALTIGGVYGRN